MEFQISNPAHARWTEIIIIVVIVIITIIK